MLGLTLLHCSGPDTASLRERISINEQWSFFKYDSPEQADHLIYGHQGLLDS
jgi:hypothetical protein